MPRADADPVELQTWIRAFATLIEAGMPLLETLDILKTTSSSAMSSVSANLIERIQNGCTLSRAMTAHPEIFPPLCIGLVQAGELGGVLDQTLRQYANILPIQLRLARTEASLKASKMALWYGIFGILLGSGVPILLALEVVGRMDNEFGFILVVRAEMLKEPRPLAELIEPYIPRMASKMISIGEESGTLDQVLLLLATYYQADARVIELSD